MSKHLLRFGAACFAAASAFSVSGQTLDHRLREIWSDPDGVVDVLVKRGIVTHIALDEHEAITEVASGLGADCAKPDASWCIAAQAGGRNIFIKPKTAASAPNNLAVVTDRRSYAFRLIVLPERDIRAPTYRLSIRAPVVRTAKPQPKQPALQLPSPAPQPQLPSAGEVVSERVKAAPKVVNAEYSIAEGKGSADIVPTLIFDDGRFTYLQFPNNREVPAVFHVLDDGSETVVNTRMEGDLLIVDRVSRRLMLRSGWAFIGVWNEAFDLDGIPPAQGTTVNGVARVLGNEAGTARTPILRGGQP